MAMEVKKEAENPPQLGDSRKNESIPELISTLRTAFRAEDFDRVEEILVGKEADMKREMKKKKEEIALFQKAGDFDRVEKVKLQTELKAANERAEKAKECYERLLRDVKKGGLEDYTATIAELRKKNTELESAKNLAEEELERWKSRYEERVSRLEEEIKMMNSSMAVDCSGPMEVIEGNEDDNGGNGNGGSVGVPSEENVSSNSNENAKIEPNAVSPPHPPTESKGGSGKFAFGDPILVVDSDDDCAPVVKKERSQNLADIEDSSMVGVENRSRLLKRKRPSFIDLCKSESNENHEDNTIPIIQMKQHQELSLEPIASPPNHCSEKGIPSVGNDVKELHTPLSQDQVVLRGYEEKIETVQAFPTFLNKFSGGRINQLVGIEESTSSSESEDTDCSSDADADINQLLSKYQKNEENKRWASEADMAAAFEKDSELCLNAVCALYRQHMSSVGKSLEVSPLSNKRGFNKLDAPRGIGLAKFLINEDPQMKLKRSVKELELRISKGLSECRRLAVEHSKQLFKIYQDKEDPFFIPP